jgi:hypothetical protein
MTLPVAAFDAIIALDFLANSFLTGTLESCPSLGRLSLFYIPTSPLPRRTVLAA